MKKPKWNLDWNEGMSVGIPEIDEDHKRFISLINELNLSITERLKATEIKKRLQHLIDDTNLHFELEEQYFRKRNYPNTEGHVRSHKIVKNTLKNIYDAFMPYGLEAEWLDAALIIKQILIGHILTEDMQYASYYQSLNGKNADLAKLKQPATE